MRVALLDLGVGNLHSLEKALALALPEATLYVDADPTQALAHAELLVFPGVGAFSGAAERLAPHRAELRRALASGLPALGVCLGMQLFFEASDEGPGEGLGLIPGRVERLSSPRLPHMGWTPLEPTPAAPALPWPEAVYYAHSYGCRPLDERGVLAWSSIEGRGGARERFAAIVRHENTIGCQFHPEKSSAAGLALLGALAREVLR